MNQSTQVLFNSYWLSYHSEKNSGSHNFFYPRCTFPRIELRGGHNGKYRNGAEQYRRTRKVALPSELRYSR